MSFKRDGDDSDMFTALNHQRVSGLLMENIPEDEALLLSNGRFSCAICLSRPIFDTISVLTMHRKGKKHLRELTKHLECMQQSELRKQNKMSAQVEVGVTPNSYVRKYLKKLPRKSPFTRKVEEMRENYGTSAFPSVDRSKKDLKTTNSKTKQRAYSIRDTASRDIKLYESGWLRNKDGHWSKNPDVEFDSDDENPPD